MKKIIVSSLLISLFSINCASAQGFSLKSVKNLWKKNVVQSKVQSDSDEMSKSEQAVLLYNENNVKSTFETILSIKEADRTVTDWILLGNILQDQGKDTDAMFMYQRAIMLDPDAYRAYYNLGNIYLADDKPFLAIDNYRSANKINNQFPYAYYNLGCAYLKAGNLKKAKIAFIKAIDLKNTEPDFHYNLAYTYKMLNNPKLAKQYLGFYNKLMENSQNQSN